MKITVMKIWTFDAKKMLSFEFISKFNSLDTKRLDTE
jgi:hypothetical protein